MSFHCFSPLNLVKAHIKYMLYDLPFKSIITSIRVEFSCYSSSSDICCRFDLLPFLLPDTVSRCWESSAGVSLNGSDSLFVEDVSISILEAIRLQRFIEVFTGMTNFSHWQDIEKLCMAIRAPININVKSGTIFITYWLSRYLRR